MPIGRDRDYCNLTGISRIPGGSLTFGCRVDLGHFLAWRAGTNSRYSMGEKSAHKSRVARAPSSLGDYMFEIHHINKEENVLISGTREKSAVGDSAEPKQ
jgi:hypothetical protein